MSEYIVTANYPASHEETERWDQEAQNFEYQEGDPRAPKGSEEQKGWGIHPSERPPHDLVEYIMGKFREEVANVPQTDANGKLIQLRPQFKWSVLSICFAHFLWLREEPGAKWLMRLYEVEEVDPFWDAYSYFHITPGSQVPMRVDRAGPWELRIFRRIDEREKEAPVNLPDEGNLGGMIELLRRRRDPDAYDEMPIASDDLYQWASAHIRDWLVDPSPSRDFPVPRPDRISGEQWVRTLERSPGVLFYEGISNIEIYKRKAFRLRDARVTSGRAVAWCGPENMKAVPNIDLDQHGRTMQAHDIDTKYRCVSCNSIRNCTPLTGKDNRMCAWCYGATVERDERPTMSFCTRSECRSKNSHCEKHISNQRQLTTIKNKLNRGAKFPVGTDQRA
jgi:hypothetical protein